LLSGLLGVGGGVIIVPMLVLWLRWEEHIATATSLGAVVFVSIYGSVLFGIAGKVDVVRAILIGLPAVGGVLVGTRISARLHGDTLLLMFVGIQLTVAVLVWFR
jgi:uncharacterized membrane protein YfcA